MKKRRILEDLLDVLAHVADTYRRSVSLEERKWETTTKILDDAAERGERMRAAFTTVPRRES